MRFLIFLLAILFSLQISSEASAQGFSIFNNRNHPEIDWVTAETEHFKISYPTYLTGIENIAAAVAEESYISLSKNLEVEFEDKIQIFFSDEDEIANGFASPIGNGFTNIWVNVNEFADFWVGNEKWMRKVLAHELGHIFHYRATKSNIGLLGNFFGTQLNRTWTEGLAQYETEKWDASRGETVLRTAILEDKLSIADQQSIWNGRLQYALGNSQLRYFADQYGDSTLVKLLAHRSSAFFGLVSYHDFYTSFKATTKLSYPEFFEKWRRHTNIYYNTLVSQLQTPDSLEAVSWPMSDRYVFDLKASPDDLFTAAITLKSIDEPIQKLILTPRNKDNGPSQVLIEGVSGEKLSWNKDSDKIAFHSIVRGPHGSLINDVFVYDLIRSKKIRITENRRASYPAFSTVDNSMVYVVSSSKSSNLYHFDLDTQEEKPLTFFDEDSQLLSPSWSPSGSHIAFELFSSESERQIAILDLASGEIESVLVDEDTYKNPQWGADDSRLYVTGHKDDVPNIFSINLERPSQIERISHLQNGAKVLDWIPADSSYTEGSLVILTTTSKTKDDIYRIDAKNRSPERTSQVPDSYASWTSHKPPSEIAWKIEENKDLIKSRYEHKASRNIGRILTFATPFVDFDGTVGLAGFGTWTDPLGKHLIGGGGIAAINNFSEKSTFQMSYVNRVFEPTLILNLYQIPSTGRTYDDGILLEQYSGAEAFISWPINLATRTFDSALWGLRLRAFNVSPLNTDSFDDFSPEFPTPESGGQVDVQFRFQWKHQKPWRYNIVHPLTGRGFQFRVAGAPSSFGNSTGYVRPEISLFNIFKGPGYSRLFVQLRGRAQWGKSFAQDFLYLSKYDFINFEPPSGPIVYIAGQSNRVRGHRAYSFGNRILFGSAEYRIPLTNTLNTQILGLVDMGATAFNTFVDFGQIWTDNNYSERRSIAGAGIEIKNGLNVFGFELNHAVGVAWPLSDVTRDNTDLYYRVQSTIPF